jgi:hypothetical protein
MESRFETMAQTSRFTVVSTPVLLKLTRTTSPSYHRGQAWSSRFLVVSLKDELILLIL